LASQLNREAENIKLATETIIIPKDQEIEIQDLTIGNFTKKDLELT